MTEITPEKLRDFQLCRHLYKRKHIDGASERKAKSERDSLADERDDALVKTIKWFYFETMAGGVPSYRALIWKWEKLWFKNVTSEEIMTASNHPGKNRNAYNTEVIEALSHFHNTHKHPGEVLVMNEHYEVPLTEKTKAIGTIDLIVRQGKDIVIKQIATRGGRAYAKGTELGYRVILDSIAFRYTSGSFENQVVIEHIIDKKKSDVVVTDIDINQVRALADEIDGCVNFYPSPGCYFCNQCRFKKDCWTYQQ